MNLNQYIQEAYQGNKAAFARDQNVHPQQVSEWVRKGFIVVEGLLYSPRRALMPALPT